MFCFKHFNWLFFFFFSVLEPGNDVECVLGVCFQSVKQKFPYESMTLFGFQGLTMLKSNSQRPY